MIANGALSVPHAFAPARRAAWRQTRIPIIWQGLPMYRMMQRQFHECRIGLAF